jgi:hypothetical protein
MPAEDYMRIVGPAIKKASLNTTKRIESFRQLFILNNLNEFYKDYQYRKGQVTPFKVTKDRASGKFTFIGEDENGNKLSVRQKGAENLLDYSQIYDIVGTSQQVLGSQVNPPAPPPPGEVGQESDYFQLSNGEVNQINPQLEKELMSYLKDLGVDVQYVNQITDAEGNPVNAYGKASLVSQVIQLTKDRKTDTLAEEASHMITGMLGMDHPIMKQMMSQISNYEVYDRVKVEYADTYSKEEDFRFEAVGKLIAEHIIKKQPLTREQRNTVDNWWSRLLNILKRLFSKFSFENVNKQMDIFEKTAQDILDRKFSPVTQESTSEVYQLRTLRDIGLSYNMSTSGFMPAAINPDQLRIDLNRNGMGNIEIAESTTGSYYFKRNGKKVNPVKDFYQKAASQAEAVQKLKDIRSEIKTEKFIDAEGREFYITQEGKVIPQRVTMIVEQEQFKSKKSASEIEKIQNDPRSKVAKHFGINLHDMYERFTNFGIAKYSNLTSGTGKTFTAAQVSEIPEGMKKSHMDSMAKAADTLLSHISEMQKSIDENGTASIHTEQVLRGEVRGIDTAGTMDVVVIFSDGSASIFDFKFINYKKQLIGNQWILDPESQVPFYKRRSYEAQIGIYKNMLRQIGITNFRETRILPNNIQFKYNKQGLPIFEVSDLNPFNDDKTFTKPLPVDKELTGNETLDRILTTLFKQNDMLDAMIAKSYTDREKVEKLSIQKDQLSKTIQSIQVNHDVTPLLDTLNNLLKNEAKVLQKMNSLDDAKKLYNMYMEMQALAALKDDIIESVPDRENKQKAALEFSRMSHLQSTIMSKIREILEDEHEDIKKPQRELGFLRNVAFLSKIGQPAFEIARRYIKESFGNINRDVEGIVKEAEEKRNALATWAAGRGMSLIQAYRKIINPATKNLIFVFSKEFYEKKTQALEKEDIKWLKDNYAYSEEGKAKFKEALKQFTSSIELTVPSQKAREWFTEKWLAQNDLSRDSAWLNKYALSSYAQVKDPTKWYSAEYKTLLEPSNKALKEYYDWFVEKNKHFNKLVPERIGKSFIPNIQKDIVDVFAQGGTVSVTEGWNEMINGLRVRQNDIMETGDGDVIPLMFYDNFLYKNAEGDWEVNTAKKSEDLTSSMILFAESVYRKHHMSNIQHIMDLLKLHLSEQDVIETDFRGRPVPNETKTGFKLKKSDTNLKTFEKLIKGLVYNNKLQGQDFTYEVKGKVYSGTKTVKQAMAFLSAKALGWNYISAFGNLMGGYANMFIKASGGLYFNKEQLSKARSMMVNRGADQNLFHHMAEYFKVEKENWIQRDAARLSASSITRNLTYDKIYLLQQKGDEAIGNTVLIAMLQNYGLDADGNIQRLNTLPAGSKSLLERVKREGDKISIEGLSNQAFDDFRGRVKYVTRQIKGTNTQEDISGMQTDLAGQVLLQFRSWVAPMVEERYGSMKYTDEIKEWEYGRYRSLLKTLAKDKFIPNIKKIALDVVTLGAYKYKGDTALLKKQYEQWKIDNPDMADKISEEEYLALRERTIREAMVETRMIAAFFVMLAALGGDWDDDGRADYKKYFATRQFQKLANRAYLELSFFSNPTSFNALIKDPVPIFSLMENMIGLTTNTVDETMDTLMLPFGVSDDPKEDKKGKLYYSKKLAIGVRWLDYIIEDYSKETQ